MEQQYKYYYTYKVTCTEGSFKDKIYYGQHKTNDLNDGYKGSGRKLKDYYSKYPTSYTMEIIQFYSNLDELNKAEYELIEPHLGKDYCLNLRAGGMQPGVTEEVRKKQSEFMKGNKFHLGKKHSEESKRKNAEASKGNKYRVGKKHTQESIRKMSEGHMGIIPWNKGMKGCNAGRIDTLETRQRKSDSKKEGNNPNSKQCTVNGKTYDSISQAWRDICPELTYAGFKYRYIDKNKNK